MCARGSELETLNQAATIHLRILLLHEGISTALAPRLDKLLGSIKM